MLIQQVAFASHSVTADLVPQTDEGGIVLLEPLSLRRHVKQKSWPLMGMEDPMALVCKRMDGGPGILAKSQLGSSEFYFLNSPGSFK